MLWDGSERRRRTQQFSGWPACPGALLVSQSSEWPPFRSEWVFWEVRAQNFDAGARFRAPFFGLSRSPLFGGQKTSKCEHSKNQMKHPVDRPKNACCLIHLVSRMCFSPNEKCTSRKFICSRKFGTHHFCTVLSTICGTVFEENEKHGR